MRPAVQLLPFTQQELHQTLLACAAVNLGWCSPCYLQDFLALRLRAECPGLADKVRGLSLPEAEALHEYARTRRGLPP
jgi:hypothetical protein